MNHRVGPYNAEKLARNERQNHRCLSEEMLSKNVARPCASAINVRRKLISSGLSAHHGIITPS